MIGTAKKPFDEILTLEIATRLLKEISPMVQGIHFMPLGWSDLVPQLAGTARDAAR